jgi:hypothetical protein
VAVVAVVAFRVGLVALAVVVQAQLVITLRGLVQLILAVVAVELTMTVVLIQVATADLAL